MAWRYFILGKDKTPLPSCDPCREADPEHDREACDHLVCHGFYAATDDLLRLERMRKIPHAGHWAVRTGAASDIIVLDAEGTGDPSGVDVLDTWESWSGGWPLPTTNRVALTPSGGVHRYYRYVPGVRSRNRVLPGLDIKSDGGYVVVPSDDDPGRVWLLEGEPGEVNGEFAEWLRQARGRSVHTVAGRTEPVGYDYKIFHAEGCPGGMRDEFFNELIFRLRKAGVDRGTATVEVRNHWKRCAQPPDAVWYMPFHHIKYKIERIWRTVEPADISAEMRDWATRLTTSNEPVKVGRVTLVRRES